MSEKLDKFIYDCTTNKKIDMFNFFTKEQLELLEKIGVKIDNIKYTINEFDERQSRLLELYNNKELQNEKGITKEQCNDLLNVFDQIGKEYSI